jgi:hypothetical protein
MTRKSKGVMSEFLEIIKEAKAQGPVDQNHVCQFCSKRFVKESTLAAHLCENKRRNQQRDEIGVRLAFQAYLRFYELTQGSAKKRTYDDFVRSSYYVAFTKFGRHLHSIRAVNPTSFIEYVIKNNKKLDHWCRDKLYEEYLLQYLQKENPQDALERGIMEMQVWADEEKSVVKDFFRYANTNKIAAMITNGRISPWLIYCSDTGQACLGRFNDEQVAMVYAWIDPEFWQRRLKTYAADAEWCRNILTQAGF